MTRSRTRDLARLTHLLRLCAYTAMMIATTGSAFEMARISELARKVEAIADEMDGIDDDSDPLVEIAPIRNKRRDD